MLEEGILLALPAQSVAVRLVLGAVAAFVAVRLLLRAPLRTAAVRVATAMLPIGVLVVLASVSLADPRLPTLMVPAAAAPSQVVIGLGSDYLYLAPLTLPAIVAAWALVATTLMVLRTVRVMRTARAARRLVGGQPVAPRLRRTVMRLARDLQVTPPDLAVGDIDGGAAAIGLRRPVLVMDGRFLASLDDEELEGVVAHELAHVARRDNLLAHLSGLVRDLTFFLPGGTRALRHLLVERELAADERAVAVTRRPGALAGGLLKVADGSMADACAALAPHGTLATRVKTLCAAEPSPQRLRSTAEIAAVSVVFAGLVATAVAVPRWAAGADPESGVAVLLSLPTVAQGADSASSTPALDRAPVAVTASRALPAWSATAPPRALRSYQGTVEQRRSPVTSPTTSPDDDVDDVSAGMLAACASSSGCQQLTPAPDPTLELHPETVVVQREFPVRWHAQPVGGADDSTSVVRFYYLSSLPE